MLFAAVRLVGNRLQLLIKTYHLQRCAWLTNANVCSGAIVTKRNVTDNGFCRNPHKKPGGFSIAIEKGGGGFCRISDKKGEPGFAVAIKRGAVTTTVTTTVASGDFRNAVKG